ncbi:MAG TPA: acyl-CoA carboxylase subunit epsilon [Actinomycetes bacterium]|nr:acyl-CoA carboxylase subunit epsilon [Actinomycetes bacterium]
MSVALDPPLLRVLRGEPDADQLAALLAVVTSRGASGAPHRPAPASTWADPARRLRPPMRPGPGAWRRSGLPR